MKNKTSFLVFLVAALLVLAVPIQPASAQPPGPVVQAVLFHSPFCSHCIYVITEFLPGVFEQYGGQLELFMIDVTQPEGQTVFLDAVNALGAGKTSVPFLVIGETYLIGSAEIPLLLTGLIDSHLASGGISWPDLPGLANYMESQRSTQLTALFPSLEFTPSPLPGTAEPSPAGSNLTLQPIPTDVEATPVSSAEAGINLAEKLARDPIANILAILILIGMLTALAWCAWYFLNKPGVPLTPLLSWSIFALCLLGLGVAGYLTFVETQQVEAYCGVVGDCNTVQQSEYARVFGVLPIGILGVVGYLLILAVLSGGYFFKGKMGEYASLAMLLLTLFATLFSIYLTFLEPFVIGATCLWCLSSAVISTLLMLLAVPPGKLAFTRLTDK